MNHIFLKIKNNKNNIFYLFIILLIHGIFLNNLEKQFFGQRIDSDVKFRPLNFCRNSSLASCLGMPSGHTELAVILSIFLYVKKFISFEISCLFVFLIGVQRIIFNMHTFLQVFVGIIFGLFYSYIYVITDYSYKSLLITIFFTLVFFILSR